MEIRTLQTTFDGFNFEFKKSSDAEKISSRQRLTPQVSTLVDLPSPMFNPGAIDESQPVLPLSPLDMTFIDMTQWELPDADLKYYWVVVPGHDMPVRVNCNLPDSYFQDLLGLDIPAELSAATTQLPCPLLN